MERGRADKLDDWLLSSEGMRKAEKSLTSRLVWAVSQNGLVRLPPDADECVGQGDECGSDGGSGECGSDV